MKQWLSLICFGVYGYPKVQDLKIVADTIRDFLPSHNIPAYLIIFDRTTYAICGKFFADIDRKILFKTRYKPSLSTESCSTPASSMNTFLYHYPVPRFRALE